MYYVVETIYDRFSNHHYITIMTNQPLDDFGEPLIEGERSSIQHNEVYLRGAYDTLEEARDAVEDLCADLCDGHYVSKDSLGRPYTTYKGEVESYRVLEPWDSLATGDYLYNSHLEDLIEPHYTMRDLKRLLDEINTELSDEGGYLDEDTAMEMLIEAWSRVFMRSHDFKGIVTTEHTDEDLEKMVEELEAEAEKNFRIRLDRDEALEFLYDYRDKLIEEKEKAVKVNKPRFHEPGLEL